MIRRLIRLMLIALVLVAGAFFLFGYWSGGSFQAAPTVTGIKTPDFDADKAREAGAAIGERTAVAAARVSRTLDEGSLTAKIKAKMVLDDLVKARNINVTTDGTTVTLAGVVNSQQERERALALARETEGVAKVIDNLSGR
jgi:hyperosmotically inducible periplasmic protein